MTQFLEDNYGHKFNISTPWGYAGYAASNFSDHCDLGNKYHKDDIYNITASDLLSSFGPEEGFLESSDYPEALSVAEGEILILRDEWFPSVSPDQLVLNYNNGDKVSKYLLMNVFSLAIANEKKESVLSDNIQNALDSIVKNYAMQVTPNSLKNLQKKYYDIINSGKYATALEISVVSTILRYGWKGVAGWLP